MSEDAAVIWTHVVACMRPSWFTPESHQLLCRYCFAQAQSAKLEGELIATPLGDPMRKRLLDQYDTMAKLALSYGRSLRLAPKDNKQSKIDGRDPRRNNFKPPWEWTSDEDDPLRHQKKPWEL
jgi:hypothetical protein